MKINRPVAPPRAAAVEAKPAHTASSPPAVLAQTSKGWTPNSVIGVLDSSLDAVVAGAKKLNAATKPEAKHSEGRTATTPYKYEGALEIGLETLNRTLEGGGVDLAKGAKFIAQNAKLPDNE